jgi:hypothetical protein
VRDREPSEFEPDRTVLKPLDGSSISSRILYGVWERGGGGRTLDQNR